MSDQILDSVVIVDLTTCLAGPMASRLLAEHGAEVIKVEPPGGDPARSLAGFATWNRSKRSVVVDLSLPAGVARLHELLAGADVLLHGLRPSAAAAIGLDPPTLSERLPGLIVSAVLGYPSDHEDAERPGHDILVQARSGAMDEDSGVRAWPTFFRLPMPSWAAAFLSASAVVGQLLARRIAGVAAPAETSLYQGMLAVLSCFWYRAERPTPALEAKFPTFRVRALPGLTLFKCSDDRWIHILFGFVENPLVIETIAEMGEDPPVVEGMAPSDPQLDLYREMFLRRPSAEWLRAFHEGDVPAALVDPVGALFQDEQAIANGYVIERDDREWGRVRQSFIPFRVDPPAQLRGSAPRLGEHDDLVLPARAQPSSRPTVGPPARLPFNGVKVLDFGAFIAGPFSTALMAELGADVVKVEPAQGDTSRRLEGIFSGSQRGKRSLAIDLARSDAAPVLRRLLEWADVVHHNMRMPAARRLGLDYEAAAKANPRLVYSHVSAYGHTGPRADWPGYDPISFASSGWAVDSAPEGARPMPYRLSPMDLITPMASVLATGLALYQRERTGRGSMITTSMLGLACTMSSETMLWLDTGELAPFPKIDDDQTGTSPWYRIYQVADGDWIAVAAMRDRQRSALLEIAGAATSADLPEALGSAPAAKILARLEDAGVPAELVRTAQEQPFFDGAANQRFVARAEHPVYGAFEQPAHFWTFRGVDPEPDLAPPMAGHHSMEVLSEVGVSKDEIERLIAAGIVHQWAG